MTTRRWGVAILVAAAVTAVGMGLAVAGDRGSGQVGAGMMGGSSMGAGMMGAGDMEAMHQQMMSSMAGTVSPDVLARCDKLHDQMWSVTTSNAAAGTGHASHHGGTGNPG